MDDATANNGALLEAVAFLSYFKGLPDLRQRGKVLYTLEEVPSAGAPRGAGRRRFLR